MLARPLSLRGSGRWWGQSGAGFGGLPADQLPNTSSSCSQLRKWQLWLRREQPRCLTFFARSYVWWSTRDSLGSTRRQIGGFGRTIAPGRQTKSIQPRAIIVGRCGRRGEKASRGYEYFWLLTDKSNQARKVGRTDTAVAEAERVLTDGSKRLIDVPEGVMRAGSGEQQVSEALSTIRAHILDALVGLSHQ